MKSAPARSTVCAMATTPEASSKPARIFAESRPGTCSRMALRTSKSSAGFLSMAEPAPFFTTRGAGQPRLMSTTSAPAAAIAPADSAMCSTCVPMTCTESGTPGTFTTWRRRCLWATLAPAMRTNSVQSMPMPPRAARISRNSGCVTPSIGASIVAWDQSNIEATGGGGARPPPRVGGGLGWLCASRGRGRVGAREPGDALRVGRHGSRGRSHARQGSAEYERAARGGARTPTERRRPRRRSRSPPNRHRRGIVALGRGDVGASERVAARVSDRAVRARVLACADRVAF